MATSQDAREIAKAIKEIAKELKAIRKILESWDEDPEVGEKDIDEYML